MDQPDQQLISPDTDWLTDPSVQRIFDAFDAANFRLYFVGGCVRNAVRAVPVSDVDLATDATPEEIVAVGQSAGLRAVPTGIDHGTITMVVDGKGFEITSFRKDIETDGRRAQVVFSRHIVDDARRRDFTMNALYATRNGEIVDPLGGFEDAQQGHVRFIESAEDRIREDYLRVLRYFRFVAWYSDPAAGFDEDALAAIAASQDGLETLSAERVGQEMLKLLSAPDPAPAVATMDRLGTLSRLLPGADPTLLVPLIHLEKELGTTPDPVVRLAALGGENLADRLRLSRRSARHLDTLRTAMASNASALELGYRHGPEHAVQALLLRGAMTGRSPDPVELNDAKRGAAAKFPVAAADLSEDFSGPSLGAELKRLEAKWIASDMRLGRDQLLR